MLQYWKVGMKHNNSQYLEAEFQPRNITEPFFFLFFFCKSLWEGTINHHPS
jgi:hypothetical protein